jgi:hypothetical protein
MYAALAKEILTQDGVKFDENPVQAGAHGS